jgi:monofunctional biosynthetic peptidoglycan transglycosylase
MGNGKSAAKKREKIHEILHKSLISIRNIATSPFRLARLVLLATGGLVWLGGLATGVLAWSFLASLPNVRALGFEGLKKQAAQGVNRKLDLPEHSKRAWTPLDQVSRDFLYAIVLSEDAGFFEHDGIDTDAILASTLQNLRKKKYESGASTITQQVVKNLFLNHSKSLARKTKEAIIAWELDSAYTKNQILELYLNLAEFGPKIYGAKDAAAHYFKKTPNEINAAEGAFLAILLPSPRRYHYSIYENQNVTPAKRKKMRRILSDMLSNEFISPKQYREYLNYDFFKNGPRGPASKSSRSNGRK